MLCLLRRPERKSEPELTSDYPAQIHANVDASHRGQGAGEALVRAILSKLAERNVRGVHAHLADGNERAAMFWRKLGFEARTETRPWLLVKKLL